MKNKSGKGFNDLTAKKDSDNIILKKRALALAQDPEDKFSNELPYIQIVEFVLENENFGIDISQVKEVCSYNEVTKLPGHLSYVHGIINIRGQIYSLIDLRNVFGIVGNSNLKSNKVIILDGDDKRIGVASDEICGVKKIDCSSIQSPEETFRGKDVEYINGVTNERVLLINVKKFYAEQKNILTERQVTK